MKTTKKLRELEVDMKPDADTTYDEVISEINSISHAYLKGTPEWLIMSKCRQLMRMFGDSDQDIL